MAQFNGFTCDTCEDVVDGEERVKKITRFESSDSGLSGEAKEDLCPACARLAIEDFHDGFIKPLRRRAKVVEDGDPESEQASGSVTLQGWTGSPVKHY